jgi:hypothetical protein
LTTNPASAEALLLKSERGQVITLLNGSGNSASPVELTLADVTNASGVRSARLGNFKIHCKRNNFVSLQLKQLSIGNVGIDLQQLKPAADICTLA